MKEETKDVQFVQERTIAGCINEGWKLLSKNIGTLLHCCWPVLVVCAIWGMLFGLSVMLFRHSVVALCCIEFVNILVALLFLLQTVLLMRKRATLGYFPSTKPWVLWKSDYKPTLRSTWKAFKEMLCTPKQWGTLLAILIVCGFVSNIVESIGSLPLAVLLICDISYNQALALGDKVFLPAAIPYLIPVCGAISVVISTIAFWLTLMPLAFFSGKLKARTINSESPSPMP